ncbi:hypothetical protein TOPH_03815 [Tolypocladium ophioglossoides CBS 100239]|uniref:Ankyrin 2,3/unc44 n=1 Tax=Tolypocladium ophioglossoides (strain CBS 100239) TaxID=1163406 RepID=A0A0L0ND67_TOLOC|nr:hypothetical protein TOPH_03815 [Tolypocladium ophioglossoides CBS 100239]
MPARQMTNATLSVGEVAAFSDEQLAQFMQNHRRHNGDFDLPVDGWDKLSMHDRHQLAERLKAQERILSQNPVAHSRPLDLDQLDARLRLVSDGDDIVPQVQQRMQGRITPPYSQEDELRDQIDDETEAFNDLVRDGGRPLYSISLIEQVSRNPEEHRDMLWPFWDYPRDSQVSWLVFRRQLKRWQAFRKWQIDNRGLEDDDGGFPAYVEMMKRLYTEDGYDEGMAKIKADPTYLKSGWEYERRIRRWQRHHQRERGCTGFSDYVNARQEEDDRTWKAKIAAEAEAERVYFLTQKDSRRLSIPKEKRIRMLHAATKKVVAAKELYESTKRRNDMVTNFIRATFNYVDAKKDTAGHAELVQWVLEQVPHVEAELVQPAMTGAGPHTKSKTRKRAQDEANPENRSLKKRKLGCREVGRLSRRRGTGLEDLGEASPTPPRTIPDKNCLTRDETPSAKSRQADSTLFPRSVDASPARTEGPRRSARIAARLNNPQQTLAGMPRELRPRSRAKPRQNNQTSYGPRSTKASVASKIASRKRGSSVQGGRVSKRLGVCGK